VATLHKTADELGLAESVVFVRPQPHELLSTFYRAADCCLVPVVRSPSASWPSKRPRVARLLSRQPSEV